MFQDYFKAIPEITHLSDRILRQFDYCWKEQANPEVKDNIFNSACHNDFWVNNMMIQYEGSPQRPISVKILDFQLTKFAPVALDLLFFLFTSCHFDLLQESFDELVQGYYEEFIRILKAHSCPVEKFSYEL